MSTLGSFDTSAINVGWFDPDAQANGWLDDDSLDTAGSNVAVVVAIGGKATMTDALSVAVPVAVAVSGKATVVDALSVTRPMTLGVSGKATVTDALSFGNIALSMSVRGAASLTDNANVARGLTAAIGGRAATSFSLPRVGGGEGLHAQRTKEEEEEKRKRVRAPRQPTAMALQAEMVQHVVWANWVESKRKEALAKAYPEFRIGELRGVMRGAEQSGKVPRYVKPGEAVAISRDRLLQDRKGFFWLWGQPTKPNERHGSVAIVHVRGELEHHDEGWGADSYEAILHRVKCAFAGEVPKVDGNDEEEASTSEEPSAVIMCIDSPGGVVAGLNETVKAIRAAQKEAGIPLIAYVNEMAASAAYAMACACQEIVCPKSAILGSVGVISTMISQAKKNERDGYDVRLLVSGKRKADGHVHAPITDAALEAEQNRVDRLAASFFNIVKRARGMSVKKIEGLQAGIFLGPEAVSRGLADEIMSLDRTLLALDENSESSQKAEGGNQTDRKVKDVLDGMPQAGSQLNGTVSTASEDDPMLKLAALIKETEAALRAATDPDKRKALKADLVAYKKTEKHIEHHKTEEGDDDENEDEEKEGDEDEKGEDEEEEEEEESSTKSKAPPPAEEEEEEEEEDEEEAKSAKAALSLAEELTGMKGKRALGALRAIAATAHQTAIDVRAMKATNLATRKAALIKDNVGKYVTPKEAKWLATQKMSTVEGFVAMRRKSGVIVHVDETTIVQPKAMSGDADESALSPETLEMIEGAVASYPARSEEERKTFRAQQVKAHLAALAKQRIEANGVPGRY